MSQEEHGEEQCGLGSSTYEQFVSKNTAETDYLVTIDDLLVYSVHQCCPAYINLV